VLADRQSPRVHDLEALAALAGQQLDPLLLALVEAELDCCERRVEELGASDG